MNGRGRFLPTVVALLAATALLGASPDLTATVAPASGASCPAPDAAGALPAAALAAPAPVRACSLGDAVVVAGSLAVRVPRNEGEAVTAAGAGRGAHPTVLTVARAAGAVSARLWDAGLWEASFWQPDIDAGPHPPISRFGRADSQPAEGTTGPVPTVRCGDSAGAWLGMRWFSPYRWTLRTAGMPAYLGAVEPVRQAIRAAAVAVDEGHNDCGLTGGLALNQRYSGETVRDAGIRADGSCGTRDQRNVVAFGPLDGGLLALTCLWWSRGRTVEADIRISDAPDTFTLDPVAGCTGSWDLQGTLTHEFGHVFGLGHVPYAEHGELTMSDGLPACSAGFRALGLGDYETLRSRYGTG
jgi:hypothetical protein